MNFFFTFLFSLLLTGFSVVQGQPTFSAINYTSSSIPARGLGDVAWGDYDNDGYLDFISTGAYNTSLYHNDGNNTFTNVTVSAFPAGSPPQLDLSDVAWGDYNNDNYLDFMLIGVNGVKYSLLYRNNRNGTFTNVTSSAFPNGVPGLNLGDVAWGDFDKDGDLDLFLTGDRGTHPTEPTSAGVYTRIFRNDAGSFIETTPSLGGFSGFNQSSVALGDYDGDGDLDFFVIGTSALPRGILGANLGDGTFGATVNPISPAIFDPNGDVEWVDYDNDGDLDLFVSGNGKKLYQTPPEGLPFTDVSATVLPEVASASGRGPDFGDYDNDGYIDLLFGGNMFRNVADGNGRKFTNVTTQTLPGTPPNGPPTSYEPASFDWGDYNNDGSLDFILLGNFATQVFRVYRSSGGIANNKPVAPANLRVALEPDGTSAVLSWDRVTGDETPAQGIKYNVYVGTTPGGTQKVSPMAGIPGGKRLVAELGNSTDTAFTIKWLLPGTRYYWSVQAIDGAYAGSPFAPEQIFTACVPPAQPGAFTAGPSAVCQGANNLTYTVGAASGATGYTWDYSGEGETITGTGNSRTISFSSGATSGTLSVTANNSCGSSAARTLAITVGAPPATPTEILQIEGNPCIGGPWVRYAIPPVDGATTYAWTVEGATNQQVILHTVNNATNNIDVEILQGAPASFTLRVTVGNGGTCGTSTVTKSIVTIPGPAQPGAFTAGPSAVCRGSNNLTYTVGAASGAAGYTWDYSGEGETITGTGNSRTISFSSTATSGILSVTATNGCGSSIPRTLAITVGAPPATPAEILQINGNPCTSGSVVRYAVSPVDGATEYLWTVEGGTPGTVHPVAVSTDPNNVDVTIDPGATSFTLRVTISNGGTCGTSTITRAITLINCTPNCPIITANPLDVTAACPLGTASFTVGVNANGSNPTYQWQVSTNGGNTYSNISNDGTYSGVTTTTLNITGATATMNGYRYRLMVSASECNVPPSNEAILTVNNCTPNCPIIMENPRNATAACPLGTASFNVGVNVNGSNPTYQWQFSTDGGNSFINLGNNTTYSGVTTTTLNITGATTGMNGYRYRVMVSSSECNDAPSRVATLTVNGCVPNCPSISNQPSDATVCMGENTSFTVEVNANGSNPTYQWQLSTNGGSTYSNISNDGTYSGVTTTILNITGATTGMNGYRYRLMVSASECDSDPSNAVTLTVNNCTPNCPIITADPISASAVCPLGTASFNVGVNANGSNPTYQWQVSTDGGNSFTNLGNNTTYSGVTTTTLNITGATTGMNGYRYRVMVSASECAAAFSRVATLTVNGCVPNCPSITNQPSDATTCMGANVSFNVGISLNGSSPTYQWEVSTDGGASYNDVGSATSTTLNLTGVTIEMNRYLYRLRISAAGCSALTSDAATLMVTAGPVISAHPVSTSVCSGTDASFSVTAGGGGNLSYQWQVNSGIGFMNIPEATNRILIISNTNTMMSGYQYRVIVSIEGCTNARTSNPATLTVTAAPSISSQPASTSVCANTDATFTATANGGGTLDYQWQVNSGSGFTNIQGANSSSLTVSGVTPTMNGYQYRVIVNITGCVDAAVSNPATLTVTAAPSISSQPANTSLCVGADASFSVTASGDGTLDYQWQVNSGSGFTNIQGANSSSLTVSNVTTAISGYQYRVIVSIAGCADEAVSNPATLTVTAFPSISIHPSNASICVGSNTNFSVTATGGGTLNYQWQVSTNGGTSFSDISNGGGVYSGATSTTLTVTGATVAMNNYRYRVVVSVLGCSTTSNAATLTIHALPTVAINAAPYTRLLPGLTTMLNSTVSSGVNSYTWLRNGVEVPGATGSSLVVDVNGLGTYTLRVRDQNGCFNESGALTIRDSASSHVYTYPNPNTGVFETRYYSTPGGAVPRNLAIYNSLGVRVFSKQYSNASPYSPMAVDLRTQGKGVYWIEVSDQNGKRLAMERIIIQ